MELLKINFTIDEYSDYIVNGDLERSIEVVQNIIENSIKYGDGKNIGITFSKEDNGILLTIRNSGCTLQESDITNIFESFWRGTNSQKEKGSGLGLYICRELMHKMKGEIFARIKEREMYVTVVFLKV